MSETGFVSIQNLMKSYGPALAVDDVSFSVGAGHTLALLGPSGCGKTTILRCIAGLEAPQSGRIEIGGRAVFDSARGINLQPEARDLGIVFQSYAVWPHMTVAQNVGFPLRVRRVPKREAAERTRRMLELVGLGALADRSAMLLSGGQQQRVALARALVHEPRLVLFDEALSNLDAALRHQMRMELTELQDRLGFTAIYVTHDQTEAFGLAETVVLMNAGRLEASGPARAVFERPASPFVARFFGMNVVPGRVLRTADDGSDVEVALPSGTVWGRVLGAPAPPGTEVLLCVRKEHVRVRRPGAGLPDLEPRRFSRLAGRVAAASFLGLEEEYLLNVGGFSVRALQPPIGAATGEAVEIGLRAEDCLIMAAPGSTVQAQPASPTEPEQAA